MGKIHEEKTYGFYLRESANDGSDFSNPVADYRIVYLGEDGEWHARDSAGSITGFAGSGIQATLADAAGDMLQASGADAWATLTLGAAGTMLRSTGSAAAWAVPSHVLIASEVKAGAAATFSFTGIAGTYNHLHLKVVGRCSASVFDSTVLMQFNTDSAGNYDREFLNQATATTVNNVEAFAQTSLFVGYVVGATGPANIPGVLDIDIPLYAGTTFHKSMLFRHTEVGQSTGNTRYETGGGTWRSTAAITRIDLSLGTGTNFIIGSAAYLYGIT